MPDPILNFARGNLSTGYTTETTVALASGHGARFPQPSTAGAFNAVWWDRTLYPDPVDDPNREIVRVTARSTDTLTITRAQESTILTHKNTLNSTYSLMLAPTALSTFNRFFFDIRAYGAVGDGATSNTTAIQSAIDAAEAAGGGEVYIPEGDFLTGTVYVDSPKVSFRGTTGAILRQAAAASNVLEVRDTDDITIQGIEFIGVGGDGTTSTNDDNGIEVRDTSVASPAQGSSSRITIRDCVFRDFRFNGVLAEFADNVLFENLRVINCRDGLSFNAVRHGTMRNCWIGPSMIAEASTSLAGTYGVHSGGINGNGHTGSHDSKHSENIVIEGCIAKGRNNQQSLLIHDVINCVVSGFICDSCICGINVFPPSAEQDAEIKDVVVSDCVIELATTGSPGASPGNYGIIVGGRTSATVKHAERITVANCHVTAGNKASNAQGEGGIAANGYTRDLKIVNCTVRDGKGYGIALSSSNHDRFLVESCNVSDIVAATGGGSPDEGCGIKLRNTVGSTSNGVIRGINLDDCVEGIRTSETASNVRFYDVYFGTISGTNVVGTVDEKIPTVRGNMDATRFRATGGTALVAGDFSLSVGWGTTASVDNVSGNDQGGRFRVVSAGTGQAANPTVTLTFKNGTWTTAPAVLVFRSDRVNQATVEFTWTVTATAIVMTFVGTPVAADAYYLNFICMGL